MKKITFLPFILLIVFTVNAQKNENRLIGIDKQLNEVLKTWNAPGFAVAVVEKNKIIYSKGFGYRDFENKKAVTPNTLFAIGSCTKSFTSSLLGILQSEDKVSFDEKPSVYIPKLKFFNDEMNSSIKIKDLMTHRTGLPRHDISWYLFPSYSKDSLLQRIAFQEPFTGVRETWYYNNFMFLAQGVIVEKITKKSWEDNIREKIFKPLNMTTSNLSIDELEKSKEKAIGYTFKNDTIIQKTNYYHIAGLAPAGSINSSVNEMGNWLITWINNGQFKGKKILPSSYVKQAISSQMVVNGNLPKEDNPDLYMLNYGYAWFTSSYKGHYRVEHGGAIDGFRANTCFFPSDSIGIVVLTNHENRTFNHVIRNIIADRMLNVQYTDWNKELKQKRDNAIKAQKEIDSKSDQIIGTKPSHQLNEYTGKYSHKGYGDFDVTYKNDSLFAQFPLNKFWLKHYHYDVFKPYSYEENTIDTVDTWNIPIHFITNNTGEISGLKVKFEPLLDPIKFKREPQIIEIDKSLIKKYTGKYQLTPSFILHVFQENKKIYVQATGQPKVEILPIEKNKFSLKTVDAKILFNLNEKSKVISLTLYQNGVHNAKKIEK